MSVVICVVKSGDSHFQQKGFKMKKFVLAVAVCFACALFAHAGEKSQAASKGQAAAPAPVKAQNAAPAKAQNAAAPVKGTEVKKTEAVVPLTNREKKALDLYKKVEIVTVSTAPCCENCASCNPPKGGLFSRLRAKRTATVVCENCSK